MKKNYLYLVLYFLPLLSSMAQPAGHASASFSPVTFLVNKGQWKPDILYQGNSTSTHVYLMQDGLSFAQPGEETEDSSGHDIYPYLVWNMKFINPSPSLSVSGNDGKPSKISYLSGNDASKWVIHPEEYTQVHYQNIYHNTDLVFYGSGYNLKYDYILHPGSDIGSIMAYYEGVEEISLNESGELEVATGWDMQVQKAPVAWQEINGSKKPVRVEYVLINDSTFGFHAVDGYDISKDLVIDPLFQMVWCSYTKALGASNNKNYCFGNAVDADGNVYLTGMVDGSYPTTPGAYSGPGTVDPEIFVSKFSADGTIMIYSTYISGSSDEMGLGIAVDDSGRAYITGHAMANFTGSNTYPSTPNAYQQSMYPSGGYDAILSVLNPTGTGLVYSTYLGGNNNDEGYAIEIGDDGMVYVAGITSSNTTFPSVAASSFPSGISDAFVAKFDITQSGPASLVYCVRIGGASSHVKAYDIAVNSAGNAFITGTYQQSGTPAYPTTPGAYNSVYTMGSDNMMAYVTRLSATTPVTLDFSTYIAPGAGSGIEVDDVTDEVYVTGSTNTFSFPVTVGALQPIHGQDALANPNSDAFVLKMNAAGSALIYSTFLGGETGDGATGIALNSAGEVYVTGIAMGNFPVSAGAMQPANAGFMDYYLAHINATGTALGCGGATYIGGDDADYGTLMYDYLSPKINISDHGGNNDTVTVTGTSHSQNFPTTPGSYGPVKLNGIADQPVFFKITCVPPGSGTVAVNFYSSDTVWCDKKAIDYFDISTNNPTSWQWYFQGAVPDTSTMQNPTGIYYPSYGTFDVMLVACNSLGCDSLYMPAFITEHQIPPPPLVSQSADTLYSTPAFSHQWYDLNGIIPGANNSWYVFTQPGTYFVVITDSIGCSTPSSPVVITGVENISWAGDPVRAVPNPFSNLTTLYVTLDKPMEVRIDLYDITARKTMTAFKGKLPQGRQEIAIDGTALSKGVYFCKIQTESSVHTIKIIAH